MKLLLIDGGYFAQRALQTLNMKESVNNVETEEDKENLMSCFNQQFINLWEAFSTYCDNVIMCVDSNSWRKELPTHRPYYAGEDDVLGYKKTREEKKKDSDINYPEFYRLFGEFLESIKDEVNVVKSEGLEGDDIIKLLVDKYKNHEIVIFGTDNDLVQTTRPNVFIFRNIKSKVAPYGEIVMSKEDADNIKSSKDLSQSLFVKNLNDYDTLLKLNIFNLNDKVNRVLGEGIKIAEPTKLLITKAITGDLSDNILPILRWKSSTGTRNYQCTERHIKQAYNMMVDEFTEATSVEYLNNSQLLKDMLHNLIFVTKQNVDFDTVYQHFRYNLRLVYLNSKIIPEKYLNKYNEVYENFEIKNFDLESFKEKHTIKTVDSTHKFFERSIPI